MSDDSVELRAVGLLRDWVEDAQHATGMADAPVRVSAVLMKVRGGAVWLAQRRVTFGVGEWETGGGKAEEGELAGDCALRELDEEAGIRRKHSGDLTGHGVVRFRCPEAHRDFAIAMYSVTLGEREYPQDTEPHKRGPWELVGVEEALRRGNLTPGTEELLRIVRFDRTGRL